MRKVLVFLYIITSILSCTSKVNQDICKLEAKDDFLSFNIPDDVRMPQISVFPFKDKDKWYLSFQNLPEREILIYDVDAQELIKRVCIDAEGNNSVTGGFGGYTIADMEHIYIPSLYVSTIYRVDTAGIIKQRIDFSKTQSGQSFIPPILYGGKPLTFIGDNLYIPQMLNGRLGDKALEHSSVRAVVDTVKKTVTALPMKFPPLITSKDFGTVAGMGAEYSCCCDGQNFIYSFFADEYLYKTTPDHETVKKIRANSRYIDEVTVFRSKEDDFQKLIKAQCEHASYGDILYDRYRKVYYRFAYPETEINNYSGDYLELLRSGKMSFSSQILDEKLNVIGETLFSEYTYNPRLFYLCEDGLYLSTSHFKRPDFDENVLCFQKLELKKM